MYFANRQIVIVLFLGSVVYASDAELLKTGRFTYLTQVHGKDAGKSEISIRSLPDSGDFAFSNRVTGEFKQQWEAIATRSFVPVSATLAFGEGNSLSPTFELKYHNGLVTGFRLEKPHSADSAKLLVDAKFLPDTVDQRIDWAAAISQELVVGREFAFHVFDPGTGESRVTGRMVGMEEVPVPAGTFKSMKVVYRIEKSKGTEQYLVWTNASGPRILVKEEFPNGAVTTLIKILP